MKKPLLICLTAFFIFPISCQYGTLVDGGGDIDNNYSVLGEVLSSTAVLPPTNAQSIISTGNGKYTVLLCWDSVPNAKEYSVSLSGDVEIKDERVSSPQYSFDVTLSGDSDFTAEATTGKYRLREKSCRFLSDPKRHIMKKYRIFLFPAETKPPLS